MHFTKRWDSYLETTTLKPYQEALFIQQQHCNIQMAVQLYCPFHCPPLLLRSPLPPECHMYVLKSHPRVRIHLFIFVPSLCDNFAIKKIITDLKYIGSAQ